MEQHHAVGKIASWQTNWQEPVWAAQSAAGFSTPILFILGLFFFKFSQFFGSRPPANLYRHKENRSFIFLQELVDYHVNHLCSSAFRWFLSFIYLDFHSNIPAQWVVGCKQHTLVNLTKLHFHSTYHPSYCINSVGRVLPLEIKPLCTSSLPIGVFLADHSCPLIYWPLSINIEMYIY